MVFSLLEKWFTETVITTWSDSCWSNGRRKERVEDIWAWTSNLDTFEDLTVFGVSWSTALQLNFLGPLSVEISISHGRMLGLGLHVILFCYSWWNTKSGDDLVLQASVGLPLNHQLNSSKGWNWWPPSGQEGSLGRHAETGVTCQGSGLWKHFPCFVWNSC